MLGQCELLFQVPSWNCVEHFSRSWKWLTKLTYKPHITINITQNAKNSTLHEVCKLRVVRVDVQHKLAVPTFIQPKANSILRIPLGSLRKILLFKEFQSSKNNFPNNSKSRLLGGLQPYQKYKLPGISFSVNVSVTIWEWNPEWKSLINLLLKRLFPIHFLSFLYFWKSSGKELWTVIWGLFEDKS